MKRLLVIPMILCMAACANLGTTLDTATEINECLQKQRTAFINGALYGANAFIKLSQAKTLPKDPKEAANAIKKAAWEQLVLDEKATAATKAEKEGNK